MENKKICPVCGEKLELVLPNPLMGENFVVARKCACEREKAEKEMKVIKEREHRMNVDTNRRVCFHEARMRDWTFASDDGTNPNMKKAKAYVEHWDEMKKNHCGLLLWGGVGSGKTYMAACIANALLEQEKRVCMTDFTTVSNISAFDADEYIKALVSYDLLILDDYGSERQSEFALQNVFDVINRRWESGKPLIITTNLQLSEIKDMNSLARKRINDRILDMCTPVKVETEISRRIVSAEGKKDIFRDIFGMGGEPRNGK